MKYTEAQKQKAVEKLARAYGRWNCAGGDRDTKDDELNKAAWLVIKKFGCFPLYQKQIQAQWKIENK